MRAVVTNSTILLLIIFTGCNKQLVGKWPDIIQLPAKEYTFKPDGDSVKIVAKGNWWSIGVRLDAAWINLNAPNDICNFHYADTTLQISSESCKTLFIKMAANNTNSDRILNIALSAGDYFDGVSINQKKK